MHRFIAIKKQLNNESSKFHPAEVKMSGYLKKKRNKIRGWRKMWFVLQNQLLLSYNSKQEYDNKLVPFKDALNLVPGTIVRPHGVFRFTVETTTNIYTFRCNDKKNYTSWITALVESLAIQGRNTKENEIGPLKLKLSLENISNQHQGIMWASQSWDSVYQSKNVKFARIPIAQNTARILERNGLSAQDLRRLTPNTVNSPEMSYSARNFRLHDTKSFCSRSDEVCRINQMFRSVDESVRNLQDAQVSTNFPELNDNKAKQLILQPSAFINPKNSDNFGFNTELNKKCLQLEERMMQLSLKRTIENRTQQKFLDKISLLQEEDNKSIEIFEFGDNFKNLDPVYASVDLKGKHFRRRLKEEEKPINEEGPKNSFKNSSHFLHNNEITSENIYESINSSSNFQLNLGFW